MVLASTTGSCVVGGAQFQLRIAPGPAAHDVAAHQDAANAHAPWSMLFWRYQRLPGPVGQCRPSPPVCRLQIAVAAQRGQHGLRAGYPRPASSVAPSPIRSGDMARGWFCSAARCVVPRGWSSRDARRPPAAGEVAGPVNTGRHASRERRDSPRLPRARLGEHGGGIRAPARGTAPARCVGFDTCSSSSIVGRQHATPVNQAPADASSGWQ